VLPITPVDDEQLERMLLALEEEGWQALSTDGGAAFYEEILTPHALMVVPGMVLTKERAVKEIDAGTPWTAFRIEDPLVVRLTEQSAVLTYRATARRGGEPAHVILMTSVYVENSGSWKLAFHQQTPIDGA
jgi:hypothetical protein